MGAKVVAKLLGCAMSALKAKAWQPSSHSVSASVLLTSTMADFYSRSQPRSLYYGCLVHSGAASLPNDIRALVLLQLSLSHSLDDKSTTGGQPTWTKRNHGT